MRAWIGAILLAVLLQQPDAETRVITYLRANVKPGQPVTASQLETVLKANDEKKVIPKLFNTLPRIPMAIIEFQIRTGRIPKLQELSYQFDFKVAGEMDVMLRIMESDPGVPKFLTRNSSTGEITKIDDAALKRDPRFRPAIERSLAGWEGKYAPNFVTLSYSRLALNSAQFRGQPLLLYFWFTNCPACAQTTPILVKLHEKYASKGFQIIGMNADGVLRLTHTDLVRADYVRKQKIRFPVGTMTPPMQQAYGVTLFPSMFFVNRQGRVVKYLVTPQSEEILDAAIQNAMN
jgi:thiol-disulfide isomerase/thioredoxin